MFSKYDLKKISILTKIVGNRVRVCWLKEMCYKNYRSPSYSYLFKVNVRPRMAEILKPEFAHLSMPQETNRH